MKKMKKRIESKVIREIMTPAPVTVRPDTSISDLKALFERYDFNAFPVVDELGVLRGLVSKLDLLRVFRPDWRRGGVSSVLALWAERVDDIMSRGIVAVEPDEPVETAVDLMIEARRRSLPVVERRPEGRVLVGMLSRTDLLPYLTLAGEESP
jgi:CBS domain-containing protein